MNTPLEKLNQARIRAGAAELGRGHGGWVKSPFVLEMERNSKRFDKYSSGYLESASVEHYNDWLEGYLRIGGNITHYYDYDMPEDRLYVASKDFSVIPLCGSRSVEIIVPAGIKFDLDEKAKSHNEIYLMDGFEYLGNGVSAYKNIILAN